MACFRRRLGELPIARRNAPVRSATAPDAEHARALAEAERIRADRAAALRAGGWPRSAPAKPPATDDATPGNVVPVADRLGAWSH